MKKDGIRNDTGEITIGIKTVKKKTFVLVVVEWE